MRLRINSELLLIKEGLWENITEEAPATLTEKWNKNDDKSRATIGLIVEDSQLIHIRQAKTAREGWDPLKKQHEKSNLTNKVFLLKRICSLKLEKNGNMQVYVDTMLNLIYKLSALGETLKANLDVTMLLVSLPDSYSTLVTALESRSESDLTLDFVKGKLIDEYQRRRNSNTGNSSR